LENYNLNEYFKNFIFYSFYFFLGNVAITQKFAFVDSEYILDQMESYQKAQKQIDDLAAKWQKELDQKMKDIESKVNELRKNELILPEDKK
jgi:outer membrane protein